ncbi:hypothetical protein LB518_22635 [Mesorhizobium sp. BR1-1-16]|uniref:hypothetical protein n=1 Tax=Mesorhizobium sp. BR1-1-16 TaxID=2876653 RepID=UPI001CCD5681|nr:hypothetical protein [Mesorhizobium sp. BR1-1-16]MBZ9939111.1 hypothetical protein [Mesorhizobium sp. BR1-1-16]
MTPPTLPEVRGVLAYAEEQLKHLKPGTADHRFWTVIAWMASKEMVMQEARG